MRLERLYKGAVVKKDREQVQLPLARGVDIAAATVEALQTICPHAGCFVDYRPDARDFLCPCHNSTFAIDGAINDPKSPSPRAMDTLPVELREGEIWIRFENFQAGQKAKRVVS